MSYPNAYLYLTAHWQVAGTTEVGQFGLKFDTTTPASAALVAGCASHVSAMWSAATMDIPQEHRLVFLRLASIGTDGKYVPGTLSYDYTYPAVVPGAGALSGSTYPLQVAHVMTLRTALPRGQAHVGRCYLPPIDEVLSSNYQWTATQVSNRNNTFAAMISNLNDDLAALCTIFSKGTKNAPTVGAKNPVTYVQSDTRPDVQRRRAKQQIGITGVAANIT